MTEVTLCRSFDGSFAAAQDAAQDIGNGTVFAAPKRQPAKTYEDKDHRCSDICFVASSPPFP
jgi:hypothetical protein